MSGWLKLHRKLQDNPLWLCEKFSRGQAWVDLMMLANHAPSYFMLRGNRVDVAKGDVARSKNTLADRWKWSRGKVIRFLAELEKDDQVVQRTVHGIGIIKLCNYEELQAPKEKDGTADESPNSTADSTVGGTADGTHTRINNNNKEEKETTVLRARVLEKPSTAKGWAQVFVSNYEYTMAEAQTVSTMPMFGRWLELGVTLNDVENAMAAASAKLGGRPQTPKYLENFVTALKASTGPSVPSNHGGFEERDYTDGKFASRMQKAGAGS